MSLDAQLSDLRSEAHRTADTMAQLLAEAQKAEALLLAEARTTNELLNEIRLSNNRADERLKSLEDALAQKSDPDKPTTRPAVTHGESVKPTPAKTTTRATTKKDDK